MIMRWISEVPSKIVKIVDYGAVSAGHRPDGSRVSARIQHRLVESRDGFRSGLAHDVERAADAPRGRAR